MKPEKRYVGLLRCGQYKGKGVDGDDDGLGPIGGLATTYRMHMIPRLYRDAGIEFITINDKKDLKKVEALHIPVLQRTTYDDKRFEIVKEAKKRKLRISSILHGDILELNRFLKASDRFKEFMGMIDEYAYSGHDQSYPKKVSGRKAILVTHAFYPMLAYPYGMSKPLTTENGELWYDRRLEKRKGFCCWSRMADYKGTHIAPQLLPEGKKLNLFSNNGGIAYWFLKKLPDEVKAGFRFHKKLAAGAYFYNDYMRLLPYRYAFNLSVPPPMGSHRSELTVMEMFDMGHIPVFLQGWKHGYEGIALPDVKYIEKHGGRKIGFKYRVKTMRESFLEQYERLQKNPDLREAIVLRNRIYLHTHHSPERVAPLWVELILGKH